MRFAVLCDAMLCDAIVETQQKDNVVARGTDIKSAQGDKNPLTTNTNGEYILHGIDYARSAAANKSSPLYGVVDVENIVLAGHSMGATCSIVAGTRSLEDDAVKLVITQHPGICGPFGPPPWPSTWLKSDLTHLTARFPVLFTT